MRVVVTGANRGIGLEFTRQLLARGDVVEAVVRSAQGASELRALEPEAPGRLRLHECDVADDQSVAAFAKRLPEGPLDLLINNAGVFGELQSLEALDLADVRRTFDVNALGPIRVTRALLPRLLQGQSRKVVHLTSGMGSIGDNRSGGAYGYRMSKAALNMASKSLAVDYRDQGLVSVVVNPGWVQTEMGGSNAPTPVDVSVRNLLQVIDRLRPEDSGKFFNHTGEEYPW